MFKKILLGSSIALLSGILLGCTVTQSPLSQSTDCNRLKRQYIYNITNQNLEAADTTSSQRQALEQQLEANNCN